MTSPEKSEFSSRLKVASNLALLLASLLLAFAGCSDKKGIETRPPIQPNLLDKSIEVVGYHCICWDQTLGGTSGVPGRYALRMTALDYDWTVEFSINPSAAKQSAWECCDTTTISILEKAQVDPPKFFGLELSAEQYAPGDTVSIELSIPAPAQVKLQVSRVE